MLLCVVLASLFHSPSCVSAQDVSAVGTPQQANERIRALSENARSAPHEYTIGPGDVLGIGVFDVPELTRDLRVSESGTISIPLVPAQLHVAGLTEMQAQQKIADVLEANGLVSHPEVSLSVKERRSKPITIVGAVMHPMVYQADHNITLLEALAEAGGVSNDAGDTVIITKARAASFIKVPNPDPVSVTPPGASSPTTGAAEDAPALDEKTAAGNANFPPVAEVVNTPIPTGDAGSQGEPGGSPGNLITVNLNELLEKGDTQNNIPLQAGDVVTVPHAGIVYVLGAVNRPGGFVLSNDRTQLTALKILALAGGQARAAKLDHAIIIRKDNQGKQTETVVDLKKVLDRQAEDVQLRASDILYVPLSSGKQAIYQALQIATAVGTAVAIYRIGY